jgi:hypothetical protein
LQTSDIRKICEAPGAVREPYGAVTGTSPRFMTKSPNTVFAIADNAPEVSDTDQVVIGG